MSPAAKMSTKSSQAQNKTNKKRSIVWLNFTLKGEVAICNYCKLRANYNSQTGSTSNLLKHLRDQHPDQLDEGTNQSKKAKSKPKVGKENHKLLKKKAAKNDDDKVSGKIVKTVQDKQEPKEDESSDGSAYFTKSGSEESMHVDKVVKIEEVHSAPRQKKSPQVMPTQIDPIKLKIICDILKPRKMMMEQETSSMAPNDNNPAGLMAPKPTQPIRPQPSVLKPIGSIALNPMAFFNREVKAHLNRIEEKIDWIISGMQSGTTEPGVNEYY